MAAIVLVRNYEVRKASNQKNFGALRLSLGREGDFGEVDAKIWDLDALLARGLPEPAAGSLLGLDKFRKDEYQGRPQWILAEWRVVDGAERERLLPSFTPPNHTAADFYRRRLEELIDATPPARACGLLLREIVDRGGFREAFYTAPAARDHHQNYPGGLLEHTINVTTLALALADAYAAAGRPGLTFNSATLPIDRPVLIAAGILHDIGKLETYVFQPLPEVTDAQRWEGHLAISYAVVRAAAAPLLERPPHAGAADEIAKLLHCILSHHGQLEYGSPVAPACAEAFLLAQADMTDARLAELASAGQDALTRDPAARWARSLYHFKGGVFIGDWSEGGKGSGQ